MKLKLPNSVTSPQDIAEIIMELHEYAKWFTHESIKKRAGGSKSSERPVLSTITDDVIHAWEEKQPMNRERLDELIRVLTDYKTKAPSLTLTLAAPPTRAVKTALVDWCRQNISANVLITIQFNSTLLGGMVVRVGSHVYDWSFRKQILQSRSKFPEVLRRV